MKVEDYRACNFAGTLSRRAANAFDGTSKRSRKETYHGSARDPAKHRGGSFKEGF